MYYIQLTIAATEPQQETLLSFLTDHPATGFEQQEHQLIAYFNEPDFDEQSLKSILHGYAYTVNRVEEQNWNAVWESHFQPVQVDDFCAVRADFHPPATGVQHEIVITPKMSFGTGHHATTYMMMQQMAALDFTGKKVFDFGTGTGILAILAEKLGAAEILATDIDDWSIANALENVQRNECRSIHIAQSDRVPDGVFDIVLANINKNVILAHLPALKSRLVAQGTILLSGLLADDEQEITEACSRLQLSLQRTEQRQNWISLLFVNLSSSIN